MYGLGFGSIVNIPTTPSGAGEQIIPTVGNL